MLIEQSESETDAAVGRTVAALAAAGETIEDEFAVGFGNAKAVTVSGKSRSGKDKNVRVSGEQLQKHIVHRARKGCLLPGRLVPKRVAGEN